MYLTEPWFDDVQEKLEDLRYQGTPDDVIGDLFLAKQVLEDAEKHLDTAKSIYNLNPIRDRLSYCLDPAKVARSGETLRISAVSLRTGDLVFIDEHGMARSRSREYEVDLRKAVLASATFQLFSRRSLCFQAMNST